MHIFVVVFVTWILFKIIVRFNDKVFTQPTSVVHGTTIEIIWTILPATILWLIGIPSLKLLYLLDELIEPQ